MTAVHGCCHCRRTSGYNDSAASTYAVATKTYYGTYRAPIDCAAHVDTAAPALGDVFEGTFRGAIDRLTSATEPRQAVTGGRFRVPRVEPPR